MATKIIGRDGLAKHFASLGYKIGAEVGVGAGRGSRLLCTYIPELRLYAIDPYKYKPTYYPLAIKQTKKYDVIFILSTSRNALKLISDEYLDFVFIDGDHHYQEVKEDIEGWSKKVRKGGIISGHDYYSFARGGVIKAVDEYAIKNNIQVQFTTPTKQRDDFVPCFWWMK